MASENTLIKDQSYTLKKILIAHFADATFQDETPISFQHPIRQEMAQLLLTNKIAIEWKSSHLSQVHLQFEKQLASIPSMLLAELRFHLDIIDAFSSFLLIDVKLDNVLNRLKSIVLAFALVDENFWTQTRPVKLCVSEILAHMITWSDEFSQTTSALLDLFTKAVERLALVGMSDEALRLLSKDIVRELNLVTEKFERLAQRQKQAEIGQIKAQHYTDVIGLFLNQTFKEKRLPLYISQFLKAQWLNEIRIFLIKQGGDAPEWMRWKKMVLTLVQYYQDDISVKEDAFHKNILLNFTNELEALIKETQVNTKVFEDFCNALAYDFAQISNGVVLTNVVEIEPLALLKTQADIEKKISSSLLQNANQYEVGQWFLYQDENMQYQRAKLLLKLPELDYLLFVNLVGQKSLVIHFEQFAYLLSAKRIIPLSPNNPFNSAYKTVLGRLLKNLDERYEAKNSLIKQEKMHEQEKLLSNERAKDSAKALIEASRLKAIEAEQEEQKNIEQMADDARRQARLILNSLTLGAWVNIDDAATNQSRPAKLAVKYSATGRFVFVDVDGTVVVDCQRDELVDWFVSNKMSLLDNEDQFADRLAAIIKNIRKV